MKKIGLIVLMILASSIALVGALDGAELMSVNMQGDGSDGSQVQAMEGLDDSEVETEVEDYQIIAVTKIPSAASLYCEKQGYEVSERKDSTGREYTVCVFDDLVECNELEFMRGKCGRKYANNRSEIMKAFIAQTAERIRERNCEDGCQFKIDGKTIILRDVDEESTEFSSEDVVAETELEMSAENDNNQFALRAQLSNGRWALVKYLPDVASEKAISKMKAKCEERGCTIELKEVSVGGKSKLVYEVEGEKQAKVFGLFKSRMRVRTQINAENGDVIAINRPWWAFLASEETE